MPQLALLRHGFMQQCDLSQVRAVLFDVDGTLFSSESIILQVYHDEFSRFRTETGKPETLPSLEAIMEQIGKPVSQIFANLVPELLPEERSRLSERILSNLVSRIRQGQGYFYPDVHGTIADLHKRGFLIIAASNGRRPYVEAILEAAGVLPFFHGVPVVDNVTILNKNELVLAALQQFSLKGTEAVLVGDRAADRDAALANHCHFIACLFGHGHPDEHEGAAAAISRLSDLGKLLPAVWRSEASGR